MYFVDALKVIVRRWVIVVVGLVSMAVAAVGVISVVPTEYQATGQLILLLPADSTGPTTPTNPYINLPSELTTTASLLAGTLMTKDSERDMVAKGYESEFDVAVVIGAGPLLIITTRDTDQDEAIATRDEVMRRLDAELGAIQEAVNVPERQLISARPSSVGSVAEALPGSKIRALAVVGGLGVTITLLVAFLRDRRVRRKAEAAPDEHVDASAA